MITTFQDPGVYVFTYLIVQAAFSIGLIPVLYSLAGEMCYEKAAGLVEFLQVLVLIL